MPTYEYACTRCGQHIEVVQSMSDTPLTECGACGGTLRKVFAPIGVVFKGSGFYRTDSRGKPSKRDDAPAAKDGQTRSASSSSPSESSASPPKASEKSA
ncbi:MAG TPA: FmdB family zinc ribbon protein [Actinomycetes bacterium]|nr:FmdB family zinc ribbon protein [Actinomycetes bacterium]